MSKGLKALKRIEDFLKVNTKHWKQDISYIEKELKALEIIKPLVNLSKGQQHCWLWLGLNGMQITEEEYDLLKEVLK